MARNNNKTSQFNSKTRSKDSSSLSFFRLDKNYGPKEYDTSNKILPNTQPQNSTENISDDQLDTSTTIVQHGEPGVFYCLYCHKGCKSEPGLKRHVNKCKERDKLGCDIPEHSSVTINPMTECTANLTQVL